MTNYDQHPFFHEMQARIRDSEKTGFETMVEDFIKNASNQNITPKDLYDQVIQEVERPLIQYALKQCRGNQMRAAKMLGINRNTLHKKIKTLNIPVRKKNYGSA